MYTCLLIITKLTCGCLLLPSIHQSAPGGPSSPIQLALLIAITPRFLFFTLTFHLSTFRLISTPFGVEVLLRPFSFR